MTKEMKYFLVVLIMIVPVWIFHGQMIMKISKLERKLSLEKIDLREIEKELNEKRFQLDQKIDLEKIEKEMRLKEKMEISKEINFFRIKSIVD